jgi:cob(I)alamin adenosyltransferase
MSKGYVQVYTGDGKGKTTAALGLALRAAGAGLKVYFAQFLKGKKCSESLALGKLKKNITFKQFGKKSFIIDLPSREDAKMAQKGLEQSIKAMKSNIYNLIVLDEVNFAIRLKLIRLEDIIMMIKDKPEGVELVLTGRNAPREIRKMADLVTEMKEVKHYYPEVCRKARKGIEY